MGVMMMRKICSATLINVGVGKKIQKLYVLVVKARGGVKSAPAITLDFWLRLKKIYKMVLTSQQGWWFGY